MSETVVRWSGLILIVGAIVLGAAIVKISMTPVIRQALPPSGAGLLLLSSVLLLVSVPAMYSRQSAGTGWLGFAGYVLLQAGIVLLVVVASTPVLYPSLNLPTVEHPGVFLLGIALTLGLLLTGIATIQAGVFPRWAGILLLAATAGFFFSFFIAEFLPPVAGQVGSAIFGLLLTLALAWIGYSTLTGRAF